MLQDININWRLVTSEVPQGFILGPVLFNIFITHPGEEAECTLIQFTGDTKLQKPGDVLEGREAAQRDLDRQEAWTSEDLLKCSQDKCRVLPLGQVSPGDNTWGTARQERP